ncbi:tRNA pseudouridine(13) synthase TruD [Motiliproteus coralliicola]|uniref:tRNA pseudouridine(13) synthase TruD n=1 Tax=Motiliproteus coralliicola TaxID=2283196 RepID=UPI001A9DDE13|nr:tRNA pseudouridine(13) synthase TruD [Motiliproteus coralliicola]
MSQYDLDFPRVHGAPVDAGVIRSLPEDFQVDEQLGFEPCGEGEHLFILLRKRGENTQWIARQLAKLAGIELKDVSYAGLKDRHAVTTQWFSLWLPGRADPDLSGLPDSVEILQRARHNRKLKRGGHRANRFVLRIRELDQTLIPESLLETIRDRGVPNYFGEQRFGHDGGNLELADKLLAGEIRIRDRHKRSMAISAARSYLFNLIVAERIRRGVWDAYLEGDRPVIRGSSNLTPETDPAELSRQIEAIETHPTAPMMGRGRALVESESLALETDILQRFEHWGAGLEKLGQTRERRSVRFLPREFSWRWLQSDQLQLSFELPPGTYATSVLREICRYRVAANPDSETQG